MQYNTIYPIVFSPTGTSRRVADVIVRGFGAEDVRPVDVTYLPAAPAVLPREAAALFAVPVYGGHVAPLALRRIGEIRGEGTPALLVVLYGNRSAGCALRELAEAVQARGFVPIAAAACIGEHSYSTKRYPIAAGRPDAQDLAEAEAFGRRTAERLVAIPHPAAIDAGRLRLPRNSFTSTFRFVRFVLDYRRKQKKHPVKVLPVTDATRCTHCGRCATLCPTQAIECGNELYTDPSRCIKCAACVKGCPFDARSLESPFAPVLARNFATRKPNAFRTL